MQTLERVRQLTVNATSPKLLVVATVGGSGGITVRFADNAIPGHGEEVLAAELTAAVRGAVAGYRRGLTKVLGSDPMAVEHPRFPPRHPAAKRRRRFAEAAATLSARSTSPGKIAQMRWRGIDEIEFRLRPGCLTELVPPRPRLTEEVNAVIAATTAQRRRLGGELFQQTRQPVKER